MDHWPIERFLVLHCYAKAKTIEAAEAAEATEAAEAAEAAAARARS